MARQLRVEFAGAFYHVMNRGNAGERVLSADEDKVAFLDCLQRAASRYALRVHAYCLMDNHYHLLLETALPNLSRAMHWQNVSYAGWYNRCHKRNGHVFQGRFKALLVDADAYLVLLSRYIHLNPVRSGQVADAADYPWSSCREFLGKQAVPEWLVTSLILGSLHAGSTEAVLAYGEYLAEDDAGRDFSQAATAGALLGSPGFVGAVRDNHLVRRQASPDVPQLRRLQKVSVDRVVEAVCREFAGTEEAAMREKGGRGGYVRRAAIGLARELCALTDRELGRYFGGITGAAVGAAGKKFSEQVARDPVLRAKVQHIKSILFYWGMHLTPPATAVLVTGDVPDCPEPECEVVS
jgi:REP element-mobilizing transposase RayT